MRGYWALNVFKRRPHIFLLLIFQRILASVFTIYETRSQPRALPPALFKKSIEGGSGTKAIESLPGLLKLFLAD